LLQQREVFALPREQAESLIGVFSSLDSYSQDHGEAIIFDLSETDLAEWTALTIELLGLTREKLQANGFELSPDEAWRTACPATCNGFVHAVIADHGDLIMPGLRTDRDYVAYLAGTDTNGRSIARAVAKMDTFIVQLYYHLVVSCRET